MAPISKVLLQFKHQFHVIECGDLQALTVAASCSTSAAAWNT